MVEVNDRHERRILLKAKYEVGDLLREKVSGFKGVVLAVTRYATGCFHYGLGATKTTKDGGIQGWEWFDQSCLELVEEQAVKFDLSEKPTSGTFPAAPSM